MLSKGADKLRNSILKFYDRSGRLTEGLTAKLETSGKHLTRLNFGVDKFILP